MRHRLIRPAIVAVAVCLALAGCGSSGDPAATHAAATVSTGSRSPGIVEPRAAKAACERAVKEAPRLAASAKPEIAELCWRINKVVEDNEKTVRAICEEVANASQLSSESDRQRESASCYAAGMR